MRALIVSILFLVGLFWVVEHLLGNKRGLPWRRPRMLVDLGLYVFDTFITKQINFVVISVAAVVLLIPAGVISLEALKAGQYQGFGPLSKLTGWGQFLTAFLLGDFLLYWIHRWFHGKRLWRFHAVHHSPEKLDWLSSVRGHPVNDILANAMLLFPFLLLGFGPTAAVAAGPAIGIFALLGHADVEWDWGPFRHVIASPVYHRWHHSKDPAAIDKNFASFLPLWDILFGTHYMPKGRKPEDFGIHEPVEHTVLGLLKHPFKPSSAGFGQNQTTPPPLPRQTPDKSTEPET
jgi:sterol desaturase/sphingolipid hydroxylase (fatty acid hydroxylase superfamily)